MIQKNDIVQIKTKSFNGSQLNKINYYWSIYICTIYPMTTENLLLYTTQYH